MKDNEIRDFWFAASTFLLGVVVGLVCCPQLIEEVKKKKEEHEKEILSKQIRMLECSDRNCKSYNF